MENFPLNWTVTIRLDPVAGIEPNVDPMSSQIFPSKKMPKNNIVQGKERMKNPIFFQLLVVFPKN